MQPSKLNKIKRAVCFLVIFSLVLQIGFYPLAANAAEGSIQKFFKKLFAGFSLPDKIELTKEGKLMLGKDVDILKLSYLLPFPLGGPTGLFALLKPNPDPTKYKETPLYVDAQLNPINTERCLYIDPETGKCASPVDSLPAILFGKDVKKEENNFLKEDGSLNIVQPAVPRICQLNIIRPIEKGGENLEEAEQLARRRACNDLIRLQTAASQVAFSAKSVFQKTDPRGDCLFLKNCKSDCVLRFGEVKYTITIFDIAEFLLPTGWLSLAHKIVNVIGMLGEIKNVVTAASSILTDGINLVNGFISTLKYLGNLFTALDSLGGNLSAYLGVVAVVAQGTVRGLDEAGVDITKTTRTIVNVGTVAVGGVAAASALNKSFGSMQDMLGRFSDNMLAYGQAKTQTNQLILGIRKDIIDLMEGNMAIGVPGIKKENELAFLFQPQNPEDSLKKQKLDKIVTDFRSFFENSTELVQRMSLPGQLIGETVLEVHKGTDSEYSNLTTGEGKIGKVSIAYDFGKPVDTVYGDRAYSANFCSGGTSYYFDPVYLSALGNQSMANDLRAKTEPEYIKKLLDCALGCGCEKEVNFCSPNSPGEVDGFCPADSELNGCSSNYIEAVLDEGKTQWRLYWEYIGGIILGAEKDRILKIDNDACDMSCKLGYIQYSIIRKTSSNPSIVPFDVLKKIAALDRPGENGTLHNMPDGGAGWNYWPSPDNNINYKQDNNRTRTIEMLSGDYKNSRLTSSFLKFDQPGEQKVCAYVGDRISPWPTYCPTGTTITNPGFESKTNPAGTAGILTLIEGILGGRVGGGYRDGVLDYSKTAWRVRWEEIGSLILSSTIIKDKVNIYTKVETRHKAMMAECIKEYPFLDYLRALESTSYKDHDAVTRLQSEMSVYKLERQKAGLFNGCNFGSDTWLETFQQSYAEIDGLASIFTKVSPNYLKDWLPTILNCYKATPEDNIDCELNWENDDWRHYWEGLYMAFYSWNASNGPNDLKNILSSGDNMDTRLKKIQAAVNTAYPPSELLFQEWGYGIANYIENNNEGYANVNDFIQQTLSNQYTTRYKAFAATGGFSHDTESKVESAIEQIGQLEYQDDDLQLYQYQPDRFINGKNRKYWQSEIWCDNVACTQDTFSDDGRFGKTYDSGLADVDWQGRINAMLGASDNLLLVQEAINAGLTPDTPLINYKIEEANKGFYTAVTTTQEKFRDVANNLTYADPCYLVSNFYWGIQNYTNYPDQQWYEGCDSSNISYCCNKSDCQAKLPRVLSSCDMGTPNTNQEWQEFLIKLNQTLDQKYRFVEKYFYNFAGYKNIEWVLNEGTQKWEEVITYKPLKETDANVIINKIKIIIEALDYIWQNDLSVVEGSVNKMDELKKIIDKLNECPEGGVEGECNKWLMTRTKGYFDDLGLGSSEESSISRKFVANILVTEYLITSKLSNYISSLGSLLKSNDWQEMLSPEEMKNRVIDWRSKNLITDGQRDTLVNVIDNTFGPALSAVKREIIDEFESNLGEYAFINNDYPEFTDYSKDLICPNDIEKRGFLSRISCFEMENNATFERLKYPLQGMSQLEKAIFFLTDADQDFDGTSSLKQNVGNLKPSIKTDEMEINSSLGADLFTKITQFTSDPVGAIWRSFSGEPKGTPPKLTTEKGEIRNWKDFKEAITANPILALQEDFDNIKAKIGQVKDNLDKARNNISYNWNEAVSEKRDSYWSAANEIAGSRLGKLDASVFGNKENQQACQGVSILLGSAMPLEIEQTCKLVADGGKRNPIILNDIALDNQCAEFERVAGMEIDLTQIDSQIAKLETTMACVTKEDCANNTGPCITCPEWFCLDPATGAWTSNDSLDKKCANNPPRLFNHIIWPDTLVGLPQDSSQVKNEVCKQADIGYSATIGDRDNVSAYTCSWGQLQEKCAQNAVVDLSAFNQTCTTLPEIGQIEALKKEMACIAVEDCANGYKAGAVLHPTKNRPCVACPANQNNDIPSACLKLNETTITYANLDANPNGANLVAGGFEANSGRIKQECQAKQNAIDAKQAIVDAAGGAVNACPWSSWPCQTKTACENLKDACNLGASALKPATGREWPPQTACPYNSTPIPFAQKYQGAQDACIQSQQMLEYLRKAKADGSQAIGLPPETAIKCTELNYQKALKSECDDYEVAKGAIKDDCGSLPNCQNIKTQIRARFCSSYEGYYVLGGIDCSSGFPDLTSSAPADQEALETVRGLCEDVPDIKTPLNEIMKVYSVLIGIRSGTLASGGIKSTITDSKKLFENIKKFIKMIEELPKKMGAALDGKNSKFGKGGFKITPLKCIAKPAASTAGGQLKTGADGGLVCPEVSTLYQQIQGQFAVIREQLHQIDLSRRVVKEINYPLWKTEKQKGDITIFTEYPIKYHSIDVVYDRASSIKQKAQYVWTLTTAIDFANSQCVCGQSFCKLPFCISGLPLTLQPLKDPYCSLVWLLRIPLDDLARSLNEELKELPDDLK